MYWSQLLLFHLAQLAIAIETSEGDEFSQHNTEPYNDLINHFHGLSSIGNWYLDKFLFDTPKQPTYKLEKPSTKRIDGNRQLVEQYHERKSHRDHIIIDNDDGTPATPYWNSLEKRSINYLADSVPLKQSITYGQILTYSFDTNAKSQWANGYESLVFISASLCKLPSNWDADSSLNGLNIYFTHNETLVNSTNLSLMNKAQFINGYAEGLAEIETYDDDSDGDYDTLYLFAVTDKCDNCSDSSHWEFELGVSEKNILFLYDVDPVLSVIDVDYESGIFDASGVSFNLNKTFELFVFNTSFSPLPIGLNQSWCAIHEISENDAFSQRVQLNSTTVNNDTKVFPVTNLEGDTEYEAVLVINNDAATYGGGVFQSFAFKTADNMACKLLYNLEFCDTVAYAVPNSFNYTEGLQTWEEISQIYDSNAKSYYEPFSFALQQTSCNTELDARYSPLRTCEDCAYSYRQWLCAVTIPRCDNSASDENQHKVYAAGKGRNEFIEETIIPPFDYSEIQPCLNTCYAIVKDCPSEFGFGCPKDPQYIKLSYGDLSLDVNGTDDEARICNYLGDIIG